MVIHPPSATDLIIIAEKLPAAPRLLVELGELLRDPDVESGDITALVKQEPTLVAQLIRMANSAAYAPSSPVGSLERALACIGFAEAHRLVGVVASQQLAAQVLKHYPIDGARLRQNSLYVAVIMEELAKYSQESPRSCYTVGLLRTIGIMALDCLAGARADVTRFGHGGEVALDAWEQAQFGVTNVEAAEVVLKHWKLPHETISAIRHHYRPAGKHNPVTHLLALAASSAHDRFFGIPGEEPYLTPNDENFKRAGLDQNHFRHACEKAQRVFDRLLMAAG